MQLPSLTGRIPKAVVLGLAGVLALSLASPPARADDADPLSGLPSPTIEDPIIALLAALPTPYRPYTGPICVTGDPQCIVDVIAEMEDRLEPLAATCSHDAIFSLAYLRVTQNVKAAADNGYFADRRWLTQIDAVFAQMYFDTMDAWKAGNTPSCRMPGGSLCRRAVTERCPDSATSC